jgi:hypothetical protein
LNQLPLERFRWLDGANGLRPRAAVLAVVARYAPAPRDLLGSRSSSTL